MAEGLYARHEPTGSVLHRVDPTVPAEDQFGVLRELRDEGKINLIGLSEVSVEVIERARRIVDVATVQNRSGADALLLEVGTRVAGDGAEYPGIDLVHPANGIPALYTRRDGTPYPDIKWRGIDTEDGAKS